MLSMNSLNWPKSLSTIWQYAVALWDRMGGLDPWFSLMLFIGASFLMIWRLGAMERKGLEGTVLGTLVMPYASGFSNLIFAFVLGRSGGDGKLVIENCLVNNVTNLTLLIGLPALIWGLDIFPEKRRRGRLGSSFKSHRLNHLSMLLTLVAVLFFTGTLWAVSRDGEIDFGDGLVLVGVFLFWQVFHVFDVLKHNVHRGRSLHWSLAIDAMAVIIGGLCVYGSVERLVAWIPRTGPGFIVFDNLGWLSGFLMVLPNAFLALYYASAKRADIVFSSQVGDGHICIPMCIGLFALFSPLATPDYINLGIIFLLGAAATHFIFLAIWGQIHRLVGLAFTASYGLFLYKGLIQ
jgi:cation:H+ antiporter